MCCCAPGIGSGLYSFIPTTCPFRPPTYGFRWFNHRRRCAIVTASLAAAGGGTATAGIVWEAPAIGTDSNLLSPGFSTTGKTGACAFPAVTRSFVAGFASFPPLAEQFEAWPWPFPCLFPHAVLEPEKPAQPQTPAQPPESMPAASHSAITSFCLSERAAGAAAISISAIAC